jgi:hypothetical protein
VPGIRVGTVFWAKGRPRDPKWIADLDSPSNRSKTRFIHAKALHMFFSPIIIDRQALLSMDHVILGLSVLKCFMEVS